MTGTTTPHGYNRYTRGCRCIVCREAKRAYMAGRRNEAAALRDAADGTYVAAGIKHGYSGYKNHSCRCETCRGAQATYDRSRART